MRRPIQIQLLLPFLSVVVLAIALASGATAYFGAARVRHTQEEDLRRVVATLAESRFPLREPVLRQMSGLSGAEFVFLDEHDAVQASTLRLDKDELELLCRVPEEVKAGRFAANATIRCGNRTYLNQRVPVAGRTPMPRVGSLVVLYPEDQWTAAVRQAAYPALGAGAVAVLAVILVTTMLARRFVRPIHRLGDQTAAIARGEFAPVAIPSRDDELRDLAVSINRMTERLSQYEREVRRSEQLRTLAQLGAGMAHQLRNAATGGRMAVELHQRECAGERGRESLEVALRQLRLMESYLQRFLTLSRPRAASAAQDIIPLAALVEDVLALVRPTCLHAGIDITVTKPTAPPCICGDRDELRQLLVNLVLNAVEATSGHGQAPARIVIEIERVGSERAAISIKDSGPGPAADVAAHLFEPFVTGKPDGTGLGLFVARQIAEDHQGSVRWERKDGLTCFAVELPAVNG